MKRVVLAPGALLSVLALSAAGQFSRLPFDAYVRYVSELPSGGFYPGQIVVLVSDTAVPALYFWDNGDVDWERITQGQEEDATFDDDVRISDDLILVGDQSVAGMVIGRSVKGFREEFSGGMVFWNATSLFGAQSLADTNQNAIYSSDTGMFYQWRAEQAHTTGCWVVNLTDTADARLNIDGDATNNEGCEITIGGGALLHDTSTGHAQGLFIAGVHSVYFEARILVTDISETDQVMVGLRNQSANVADANDYLSYDTWAAMGIVNNTGGISIQAEADSGVHGTDASGTSWEDAQTKTLRVAIGTDLDFDFFLDGVAVAETNATGDADAGDLMVPFIVFLKDTGDGSPDPGVFILYWEFGPYTEGAGGVVPAL